MTVSQSTGPPTWLIGEALAHGRLQEPDGRVAMWQLQAESEGKIRADEQDHAAHLVAH
ncbi:hypothetical protein GCM10009641_39080 [Mycobacterium cookii]|uniref:Uncharacterized protein n=1 Tax=Mycobacterium cookii TaxID=1775 RepID=A0A7I7KXZ0_9MYCO|nr:hypothetical protein [Mycobacterium cookii]MCV7331648.1 hypothetical protein [Mycobacterium cookii]BBX46940.1 hypothetical protein MCOO_29550 [Mycobacterium cookii]